MGGDRHRRRPPMERGEVMRQDLTGKTYGYLTVVQFSKSLPRRVRGSKVFWQCCCCCGTAAEVAADNLRSGTTKSCGCMRGKRIAPAVPPECGRSAERTAWHNMRQRCTDANSPRFKDWGGRGITVCSRWESFDTFLADVGPRPAPGYSLDRWPNPDGNYEPGNVRWATAAQQRSNRRKA